MSREAPSIAIASPRRIPASLAAITAAWRSLTWRHYALALACSLLYAVPRGFREWAGYPPGEAILWQKMLERCYEAVLIAFPLLLAIAIANQVASSRRPWLPYATAAVVAPAIGIAAAWWPLSEPWLVIQFGKAWTSQAIFCAFVAFGVAHHRRSRQRLAALQAAQIERAQLSRHELELRLQAMQARVEPQFLFNTLTQVEKLYDADPGRARRMLDDLIVYLRAALPLIRESTSTLGKEIDLARAYLNIVKVRLGERLTYDIALSDDADDVRIPPMVLLPLIDHAIVYGLEPSHSGGSIRIATSISEGKLRLTVLDSGAGFVEAGPGNDGIQAIRDRLDALYGREAQLVLNGEESLGTRAVMEIPCERSERPKGIAPLGAPERAHSAIS